MDQWGTPRWINEPAESRVDADRVEIVTEPDTDFWQRSYYGFRHTNAPALLWESDANFTLSVRVAFEYQARFDQCGVILYSDDDYWFKASIEYENDRISRLGSVVTNAGYSDWATTDIANASSTWYRLSRRGPDFLIEHSEDGKTYSQMRIFHLHCLGETTARMGQQALPDGPLGTIRFGVYACSPLDSSFVATFTDVEIRESIWAPHA